MKIAAAVVYHNEADIIPYWLESVNRWADIILGVNNASTDNSQKLFEQGEKVAFSINTDEPFKLTHWNKLVQPARDLGADWFVVQAPDLHAWFDVHKVIKNIHRNYSFGGIKTHYPTVFLTKQEYAQFCTDPIIIVGDPFIHRRWYHFTGTYTAIIYRLTDDFKYTEEPSPIKGNFLETNLCFGHYRFRNPKQMAERLEQRQRVRESGNTRSFKQYKGSNDWRDYLIDQNLLHYYENKPVEIHQRISLSELIKRNKNVS